MEQIKVTDQSGKVVNTFQLPSSLTSSSPLSPFHFSLAYRSYEKNQHQATKKVKSRGEVKGSTRKIYRQKGTGGARHGSRYAPQFRGGGVAFGPTGQKSGPLKVNHKLKKKVLQAVLGEKVQEKKIRVIDQINLTNLKTKEAEKLLTDLFYKDLKSQLERLKQEIKTLKTTPKKTSEQEKELTEKERERTKLKKKLKQKTKTLVILAHQEEKKAEITRSFRNLPYLNKIADSKSLNFFEVLNSDHLIFTASALTELSKRLS